MSTSIQTTLESYGIDMYSVHTAVETIGIKSFSPSKCREILQAVLEIDSTEGVSDDESKLVLKYVIGQYFDADVTLDLENAIKSARSLIKRFPSAITKAVNKLDADGNIVPIELNDDGVAVGNTGKPRKGYKKDMALELYRENQKEITERSDWIELFVKEISGMTKAVANTYIHNIESGKWEI